MNQSNTPELSLVIVSYNSQFWLKKTLLSLKEQWLDQTKTQVETIVVDNGSKDGSLEMLKSEFKWVKLIELEENVGYSAGNNVALKQVESPYVMLLNSDVEFTPETDLDLLLADLKKRKKTAVITPKVLLADGELDQACHRGEPTPWASLTYFLKLEQLFPNSKLFGQYHLTFMDLDKPHQIQACSGAAMMIKTKAMNQVGLLDERFFMYAEDLDWCRRFRQAGYQIYYQPQIKIIHHKYKSGIKTESDITSLQTKQFFYNTMLQYYDKHYLEDYPRIVRALLRVFIFIKKGGM